MAKQKRERKQQHECVQQRINEQMLFHENTEDVEDVVRRATRIRRYFVEGRSAFEASFTAC